MHALQRVEAVESGVEVDDVVDRLVAMRRRSVADGVAPLKAEAERLAQEIEGMRETARLCHRLRAGAAGQGCRHRAAAG